MTPEEHDKALDEQIQKCVDLLYEISDPLQFEEQISRQVNKVVAEIIAGVLAKVIMEKEGIVGGVDRGARCRALKENGWIEVEDDMLVPPDSLWQDKPKSFYVYDAIELHGYLGDPAKMTDDLKEYCGFEGDE